MIENKLEENQDLDINARAKKFVNDIVDALNITVPREKFRNPKVCEEKWFSNEIRETAARKDEAYRKAMYNDTEQNWMQFKMERNAVKLIRK